MAVADDEGTINVASKKGAKGKTNGVIRLKKAVPKHTKPGNWRDGSVADGAHDLLSYQVVQATNELTRGHHLELQMTKSRRTRRVRPHQHLW